ncbi:MAG TPA: MoaD/ThiS family protein [Gemmatimonadales bacterium]|nr:MoaD/ThiS family protein [Gemmatimonadales bacterium]
MSAAPATITTRLLLFASYAELAGQEQVTATLPAPARVSDLLAWARASLPGGRALPERPLVAVNQRHVRTDAQLSDGDEVALLPPMAGG